MTRLFSTTDELVDGRPYGGYRLILADLRKLGVQFEPVILVVTP